MIDDDIQHVVTEPYYHYNERMKFEKERKNMIDNLGFVEKAIMAGGAAGFLFTALGIGMPVPSMAGFGALLLAITIMGAYFFAKSKPYQTLRQLRADWEAKSARISGYCD